MKFYIPERLNANHIDLISAIVNIPQNCTGIDFFFTELYRKTRDELVEIFLAVPKGVTAIYLNKRNLSSIPLDVLSAALASIPTGVSTLLLADNDLFRMNTEDLITLLKHLPQGLTSLDLSQNGLGRKTGEELARIFAAIPTTIKDLNLAGNYFTNNSDQELITAFAALPSGVKRLSLAVNDLDIRLSAIVTTLSNVRALDLSENGLNRKYKKEMEFFKSIPDNITELCLGHTDIENRSVNELQELGKVLKYIRHITCKLNKGEVSPALEVLKQHVGGWTIEAQTQLLNLRGENGTLLFPGEVVSEIMASFTDDRNELKTFLDNRLFTSEIASPEVDKEYNIECCS